jgi:hypothetical protein
MKTLNRLYWKVRLPIEIWLYRRAKRKLRRMNAESRM